MINCQFPLESTLTTNGIKFTINVDGSVTALGNPTNTSVQTIFWYTSSDVSLYGYIFPFDIIVSAPPVGASSTTYYLGGHNMGYSYSEKSLSANTKFNIAIIYQSGVSANGEVLYPMVRPACINDNTFESAALTNRWLTSNVNVLNKSLTFKNISSSISGLGSNTFSFRVNFSGDSTLFLKITAITTYQQLSCFILSRFGISAMFLSVSSTGEFVYYDLTTIYLAPNIAELADKEFTLTKINDQTLKLKPASMWDDIFIVGSNIYGMFDFELDNDT